jgi:hypothetical protein
MSLALWPMSGACPTAFPLLPQANPKAKARGLAANEAAPLAIVGRKMLTPVTDRTDESTLAPENMAPVTTDKTDRRAFVGFVSCRGMQFFAIGGAQAIKARRGARGVEAGKTAYLVTDKTDRRAFVGFVSCRGRGFFAFKGTEPVEVAHRTALGFIR